MTHWCPVSRKGTFWQLETLTGQYADRFKLCTDPESLLILNPIALRMAKTL